jgi:ataxia telangiectasia mutated family protein
LQTFFLGNYLVGQDKSSGAHGKYHPSDLTGKDCISKMKEAADKEKKALAEKSDKRSSTRHAPHEPTELPHVFRSICERFHPVFRHFFYERFADPVDWCRRRSDYTVSVATWSMGTSSLSFCLALFVTICSLAVCHLVGLGDRHLNNILIDECTAEIVHIDLGKNECVPYATAVQCVFASGMAFEYSRRALQVPEQVPFRLTRDMLDPMGAWGIDSPFTATCMWTMAVMRAHKSVLLTIISVFTLQSHPITFTCDTFQILMHDPVASFQERPIKLDEKPSGGRKVQPPPANRNGLAETAIARMVEKLSGGETIDKVHMTINQRKIFSFRGTI